MPRSRSRARSSSSSSTRRSRSPLSDHDSDHDRSNEYRVHIADLPTGVQEHEIRKTFQRFGPLMDVWVANASCFAFAVYKYKDDAQKAIDQMDGRMFGDNRLRVTWARPRTKNRAHRQDPNMRCYTCGQRGHFSRECDGQTTADTRPSRRRDDEYPRYPPGFGSYSRSRSPYSPVRLPPVPVGYFRHGLPMYPPPFSRRFDPYLDGYYPPIERPNGHDHRYRDRGTRLTPPSTSTRYSRR